MSTTPAPRSLLTRLVDDAAVFPPAALSPEQAWEEHVALRAGGYADLVGPLLVGTSGVGRLIEISGARPDLLDHETADLPDPVEVGVVARAGTSVEDLVAAAEQVRSADGLTLASVELAHDPGGSWRRALELDVPVAVEVPRDGEAQARAMAEIADAAADHPHRVIAKLRTQSTPDAPVPTARELAEFLCATAGHELPFKLTGGLHHAVAQTVEASSSGGRTTEDQHGVLNVLMAAHHLGDGGLTELTAILELREAEDLAAMVRGLDEPAVAALRARFASFGCCTVTDPLDELADLGLLARP